jgi:hypothetical protein
MMPAFRKAILFFNAYAFLMTLLPNRSLALEAPRGYTDEVMKKLEGKKFPLSMEQIKGVLDGTIVPEDFLKKSSTVSVQDVNIESTGTKRKREPKGKKSKSKVKNKKTQKPKASEKLYTSVCIINRRFLVLC